MISALAYIHMSTHVDHMITKNWQVRVLFAKKGPQGCVEAVARKVAHEVKSKSNYFTSYVT